MLGEYSLPCTIRFNDKELDGRISLGVDGIFIYKTKLFRRPKLVFYIPYANIISVYLKKNILFNKVMIEFKQGFEVKTLEIIGNRDIGNLGYKLVSIKEWGLY